METEGGGERIGPSAAVAELTSAAAKPERIDPQALVPGLMRRRDGLSP
jgi:hypothetical protein